jgi:hypothetical protein
MDSYEGLEWPSRQEALQDQLWRMADENPMFNTNNEASPFHTILFIAVIDTFPNRQGSSLNDNIAWWNGPVGDGDGGEISTIHFLSDRSRFLRLQMFLLL